MKGPSLQKTAALSAVLHLTVLLLTMLIYRQSNHFVMPSPYIVSIVAPSENLQRTITKPAVRVYKKVKKKTAKPVISRDDVALRELKKDIVNKKRIEDRISELEAKKKIERIVRLRSMINLKGRIKPGTQIGPVKGTIFDSYYAKITEEIWQEWIYPDFGEKNLETIVFVKVLKDGTIIVQKIEKSSGNNLFDRSTLKALAKATPVSPPPYEMELGIRFYP